MAIDITQIGDIVRSARIAKEWSQKELAVKIGVCKHTILAVENNQRNPAYDVLFRLVHALDIPADLIFHPNRVPNASGQGQLICELQGCNERELAVIHTARFARRCFIMIVWRFSLV